MPQLQGKRKSNQMRLASANNPKKKWMKASKKEREKKRKDGWKEGRRIEGRKEKTNERRQRLSSDVW